MPSGNFFLALNRSQHFLLKKGQNLLWQVEPNDSNLITILSIFQQCKIIKIELLSSSCFIKFRPIFNKKWWLLCKAKMKFQDSTTLRPGWIVPLHENKLLEPQERVSVESFREIHNRTYFYHAYSMPKYTFFCIHYYDIHRLEKSCHLVWSCRRCFVVFFKFKRCIFQTPT